MILRYPQAVPLDLVFSLGVHSNIQVLPVIVQSLPLKDVAENEPTYAMIIQLYQAHNHIMLSLTEQLLPALAKVLTEDEEQVKVSTRVALLELVKALRTEFPHLFEAHSGFLVPQ
jgi:hypothetical protein